MLIISFIYNNNLAYLSVFLDCLFNFDDLFIEILFYYLVAFVVTKNLGILVEPEVQENH